MGTLGTPIDRKRQSNHTVDEALPVVEAKNPPGTTFRSAPA
jgi:hypothetical protein